MQISRSSILQLYKSLYKYGLQLKFTDKSFYYSYIRKQFENTDPQNKEKLAFAYKVSHIFNKKMIMINLTITPLIKHSEGTIPTKLSIQILRKIRTLLLNN